jgi:hypothetical protein
LVLQRPRYAEQWIKEGKNAVKWTKLSCHDFADNQVRLQLFARAYNLGNFLWRSALPVGVKHWSLTTLREKLIKIGAKVVHHARSVMFQMAGVAVPREVFRLILARIRLTLAADGDIGMIAHSVRNMRNGRGDDGGLSASRRETLGNVRMAKMAAQISTNEAVASRGRSCCPLQTPVSYTVLPTTFVARISHMGNPGSTAVPCQHPFPRRIPCRTAMKTQMAILTAFRPRLRM